MIKVEHIKIYQANDFPFGAKKDKLVVESKLVLVDTGTRALPNQLSICDGEYFIPETDGWAMGRTLIKPILISETEKIIKGDLYYNISSGKIYDHTYDTNRPSDNNKKIITLPEHFSPEQLQMIVDGKLKDGERLMVECEYRVKSGTIEEHKNRLAGYEYGKIKLNPHITIYPVEEKIYTEKEMLENCISFGKHIQKQLSEISGQSFNFNLIGELKEWFEQNVK